MKMPIKLMLAGFAPLALSACGGGGTTAVSSTTATTTPATFQSQFGTAFAADFNADPNANPPHPSASDVPALNLSASSLDN